MSLNCKNLQVSSCHNEDFDMRIPMFSSKLTESDVWTGKSKSFEFRKCLKHGFSCFILNSDGFVKIPGSEPIHLDMEKLCLLSVSKGTLDFRRKTIYLNSEKECLIMSFLLYFLTCGWVTRMLSELATVQLPGLGFQ